MCCYLAQVCPRFKLTEAVTSNLNTEAKRVSQELTVQCFLRGCELDNHLTLTLTQVGHRCRGADLHRPIPPNCDSLANGEHLWVWRKFARIGQAWPQLPNVASVDTWPDSVEWRWSGILNAKVLASCICAPLCVFGLVTLLLNEPDAWKSTWKVKRRPFLTYTKTYHRLVPQH